LAAYWNGRKSLALLNSYRLHVQELVTLQHETCDL
jgi:hypothetical protein